MYSIPSSPHTDGPGLSGMRLQSQACLPLPLFPLLPHLLPLLLPLPFDFQDCASALPARQVRAANKAAPASSLPFAPMRRLIVIPRDAATLGIDSIDALQLRNGALLVEITLCIGISSCCRAPFCTLKAEGRIATRYNAVCRLRKTTPYHSICSLLCRFPRMILTSPAQLATALRGASAKWPPHDRASGQ